MVLAVLFWLGLALGLYPYVGYPLFAAALARVRRRAVARGAGRPRVSILISAYNEARHIEATIRNKLGSDYAGELEILVASDESTDGTDDIVARIAAVDPRVRLWRQVPRQGKTAALNHLVALAGGEILVFSDANSLYRADTLRLLVANFADPQVGYVTGKMVYVNPDGALVGDGCTAYMRYENALRSIETDLGCVVGVDGGVDAVRKALYRPMTADQLPDFVLPLSVVQQGYRVVYEPAALLEEDALTDGSAEFRMRVRVALRALWALKDKSALLYGQAGWLFAWQLWSHKLLRYLSFVPFTIAWLAGAVLALDGGLYAGLFAGYCAVLGAALLGSRGVTAAPARYAYYFALLNVASAVAVRRYLRGEKQVLWQPRVG